MSSDTDPLPEVHPKKFGDFEPFDLALDTETVTSCCLHITKRDDGQHVVCLEFHDHALGEDNVLCAPLNFESDTWRAINCLLMIDSGFGRPLYQNALNDLAVQIVQQMKHYMPTGPQAEPS